MNLKKLGLAGAGLGAVGAAAGAWALLEAHLYTVRTIELPILSPGQEDFTILHISDLHLPADTKRRIAWVRALAELQPDFVVNTGDNLAFPESLEAALEALEPLFSFPGAFVFGSNDYRAAEWKNPLKYLWERGRRAAGKTARDDKEESEAAGRPPRPDLLLPHRELAVAFRAAGWIDLNNRAALTAVGPLNISLSGVDDPHVGRNAPVKAFPQVVTQTAGQVAVQYGSEMGPITPAGGVSLTGVGKDGEVFVPDARNLHPGGQTLKLGLTHAPYRAVVEEFDAAGADLVFAGHTHGGQVALPGWGALVSNCDLPPRQARGLWRWRAGRGAEAANITDESHIEQARQTYLHISAGLGTNPYTPLRFGVPPEVTLLRLRSQFHS